MGRSLWRSEKHPQHLLFKLYTEFHAPLPYTSSFLSSSLSLFHFLFLTSPLVYLCSLLTFLSALSHMNVKSFRTFLSDFKKKKKGKKRVFKQISLHTLFFSVLKMFSDKKRVETALEQCGLLYNKVIIKSNHWLHNICVPYICSFIMRCLQSILCMNLQCTEGKTRIGE